MTTTPVDPTIPQTLTLASVDELRQQAARLGLTWDLRAATVTETTGAFTAYVPRIALDGDDVESAGITAVSFIGGVAAGMRVMVMFVPPVGYYIVGVFNPDQVRRYEIGASSSHGTTITTVETVMETFDAFECLPGAAYRVEVDGALIAATTTFVTFRLRKTNAAGQALTVSDSFPGVGLIFGPLRHVGYFTNRTTGIITTDIVLTAVATSSTASWAAAAGQPRYVSIQYCGPAAEYPTAVGIV